MKQKPNFPPGVDNIFNALNRSDNIETLKEQFDPKSIARGLAGIEIYAPDLADRVLGPPASTHKILIDHNLGFPLVQAIHENLGRPHAEQFLIKGSTQDPKLYDYAAENGYSAIITGDGARRGKGDLCFYANMRFTESDNASLPQIIKLSKHSDLQEQIQSGAVRALAEMEQSERRSPIIDLRL